MNKQFFLNLLDGRAQTKRYGTLCLLKNYHMEIKWIENDSYNSGDKIKQKPILDTAK